MGLIGSLTVSCLQDGNKEALTLHLLYLVSGPRPVHLIQNLNYLIYFPQESNQVNPYFGSAQNSVGCLASLCSSFISLPTPAFFFRLAHCSVLAVVVVVVVGKDSSQCRTGNPRNPAQKYLSQSKQDRRNNDGKLPPPGPASRAGTTVVSKEHTAAKPTAKAQASTDQKRCLAQNFRKQAGSGPQTPPALESSPLPAAS